MTTHVKVIAVLFIVCGALFVLAAFFSSIFFTVLAGLIGASGEEGAPLGAAVLGLVSIAVSAALLLFGAPAVVAGYGLLKFRPWARILAIILAAIALTKIPFGTLFGIYALVILFRRDTEALFTR
jgi:hypothetical protein